MEATITPTRIGKNGNTKIVDMKSGFRDKVTKVNSYEVGVKPDRRGNNMNGIDRGYDIPDSVYAEIKY